MKKAVGLIYINVGAKPDVRIVSIKSSPVAGEIKTLEIPIFKMDTICFQKGFIFINERNFFMMILLV